LTGEAADQEATGLARDRALNQSSVTLTGINIDRTAPTVSQDIRVSGTEGDTDLLAGVRGPSTATVTSSGEGEAVTVVSPEFLDRADNVTPAGSAVRELRIDLTRPDTPTFVGGPEDRASFYFGSVPEAPSCESADGLSGLRDCVVTGGGSEVGTHTYTATATDNAGWTSTATLSYTVLAWELSGFYAPTNMGADVWNRVKGGSTVPLKFEVAVGGTEQTTPEVVKSFSVKGVSCTGADQAVDEIEMVTTGGTALRYDGTSGQFVQNWQTPKLPGRCYRVLVTTLDGSVLAASFVLK
jgi:hypothetical protein